MLGANDGILSTSGLVVGVAAAGQSSEAILVTGVAGLLAGAISMAAGEYVSVKSQADAEAADKRIERQALKEFPEAEHQELVEIYRQRGLDAELAEQVATQLTEHDALGAHLRDEIGITETMSAQPIQAAVSSALSFVVGAALPVLTVLGTPLASLLPVLVGVTLLALALLGGAGAYIGQASVMRGAGRVLFWGIVAMAVTAGIGSLFGTGLA